MARSPEQQIWYGMISRCHNEGNKAYDGYGGRGITVCDRWREDFLNFYDDMGRRPSPKHTIERVDNDKGYSPENCIWATRDIQNRNHRRNRWLEFNGKRMILMDWAREIGITQQALQARLKEHPLDVALSMPANPTRKKYIEANGQKMSLSEWAEYLDVHKTTIERRLKRMPPDDALIRKDFRSK